MLPDFVGDAVSRSDSFRVQLGAHVVECLKAAPPELWNKASSEFRKRYERAAGPLEVSKAMDWLAGVGNRLAAIRVPVKLTDAELCEKARECANVCMSRASGGSGPGRWGQEARIARTAAGEPDFIGIPAGGFAFDLASVRERMAVYVRAFGIEPPGEKIEDRPAISRMTDHLWWRRRLRVAQARALEAEAIRLGYVHKRAEIYASDVTVNRRQQQRRRNAAVLEGATAINLDTKQEFTLAELAARSVANPAIRRGELMVRIAGFEAVAKALGHVGLFITQTCPARMHAKRTNGPGGWVFDNQRYDGTTPKEAARYLSSTWARIRAALARRGVAVYGFRIAEPHHDGTPHWHCLVFCAVEAVRKVLAIWTRYARREDRGELSSLAAKRARFHVKRIDWRRGTAAGYIAKYVSKNIDGGGYQVQGDLEGGDRAAITPSHRVEAWASAWGIRQFQQVGGPPVGVWRELRRSEADENASEAFEAARSAADVGCWERYVEVMGGPVVNRRDLPLRVAKTRPGERWDFKNQFEFPAPLNRYGEQAPGAVYGVLDVFKGRAVQSRRYRWEVKRGGAGRSASAGRCATGEFQQPGAAPFAFSDKYQWKVKREGVLVLGAKRPWSPVNNCTRKNSGFAGEGVGDGRNEDVPPLTASGGRGGYGMGEGAEAYPDDGRGLCGAATAGAGGGSGCY